MAGIFRVTERELNFLVMFSENHGLYGFDEMVPIETEEEAHACVSSLCEKGYLYLNQQKEYEMDSTLELLLMTAAYPFGCMMMEDLRRQDTIAKTAVYFLNDVIGIVEQENDIFELLWIPYLPLAIGEVANLHTPFLNEKTVLLHEISSEEVSELADEYLKAGFTWQWQMWETRPDEEEVTCSISVLSDGKEQIMLREAERQVTISRPDKADYVNSITECLAGIHGQALGRMLQEV